ncbi:TonB-dependent receptor plug domain-containing protein [Phreatobacter sp. AB_2022a]|uniref:TonB-dependent receptor plug domain-containing protein n=1 Tax=Phreatobacter sp. AB_2022a TaxID=3003134 RepID=UPI0022873966|nr:TonB-dependent receptor [Phreatobacter sp. AB_2022a]MCZ0738720.1 TonB-dependent receptor [Phreatobacter sp. AB_2022a]
MAQRLIVSFSLVPLLAASAFGQAADPVAPLPEILVHGASTVPVEAPRVGSAVTVVTAETIRDQGTQTLPDALRQVPGLAVSQAGGRGGITQLRIRGAEANHSLVVVDGVPINDVNNGDADLANLPVDAIERIEVVRGPQSGIWGPNAQSGVVLITTKSGRGLARPELSARVEGGSFGTLQGSVSVRGAQGPFYGALSLSGLRAGGHVAAPGTTRPNGSEMGALNAKVGADLADWFNVEGTLRMVSRTGFYNPANAAMGPGFAADPRYGFLADGVGRGTATDIQGRVVGTVTLLDGRWVQKFSADTSRQGTNAADSYVSAFGFRERQAFWSQTERNRADYRSAFTFETPQLLGARHTLVAGVDITRERFRYHYESDGFFGPFVNDGFAGAGQSRERKGLYGEYLVSLDTGLALSAALRQDWNSSFRNATSWRFTAAQSFETGTRLHASIGKGVTNPTFVEQFGFTNTFVGNPLLKPEQSIGWDVGVEQRWFGGRLTTDLTYFRANLENEIVGSGISVANLPFATARQGIEATLTARPLDWLRITGAYTYTDTRSAEPLLGGYVFKEALRRPKHAASLSAVASFAEDRGKLSVTVAHNGGMRDRFFGPLGPTDVYLRSYTLVGAQLSYDVTRNVTAYVRGENIFAQRYQEVFGYNAAGAAVYAGLRVRFGD